MLHIIFSVLLVSVPASVGGYMHYFLSFKIINSTSELFGGQNNKP